MLADTTIRLLGQEPLAGRMPTADQLQLAEILDGADMVFIAADKAPYAEDLEWALRLLRLVGWSPAERRVAETLVAMVREARWAVEQLSRLPARRQISDK